MLFLKRLLMWKAHDNSTGKGTRDLHMPSPPEVSGDPHMATTEERMPSPPEVSGDLHMATAKVRKMLDTSQEDFLGLFSAIECAESWGKLEEGLKRFNEIMRIFFLAVPDIQHFKLIVLALKKLGCSQRFDSYLNSKATLKDAVIGYKTDIVKKLDIDFQRRHLLEREDKAFDKVLLSCYNTEKMQQRFPTTPDDESPRMKATAFTVRGSPENKEWSSKKRSCSTQSPLHELSVSKRRKTRQQDIDRKDQITCSNYKYGKCRRGFDCRYRH